MATFTPRRAAARPGWAQAAGHLAATGLLALAATGVLALAGASVARAQPAYQVTQVPVFGDPHNPTVLTYANAVNRRGHVAALLVQQLGGTAAYRCTRKGCTFIAPLGNTHHGGPSAEAINDAGLVVGSSPYLYLARGYLFDGATTLDLGAFDEGMCNGCDLSSFAHGINNLGQVVGAGETADGALRAFVWHSGAMQKLGTLGGADSVATAINDRGVVAGHAMLASGAWHAYALRKGRMRDLGTLGGTRSWAYAVNAGGEVAGCAELAGDTEVRAFVHRDGNLAALPGLGGSYACAQSLNAAGQVVGTAERADGSMAGFLHEAGTLYDLDETLLPADRAAWRIIQASGIGPKGQIAATGVSLATGVTRALLLLPVVPAAQAGTAH